MADNSSQPKPASSTILPRSVWTPVSPEASAVCGRWRASQPTATSPAPRDAVVPDFSDPGKFGLAPVRQVAPSDQYIPASVRSQSVGMPSPNVPVGQSIDKPIAEDRAPGPVVQAAGSLATDPEQKRRIIAGQLFPDLSPTAAQARVFYGPNGRMAAVGMDGQPYYVDPDRPDISALHTFSPANLASNIGGLVGPSFPAAGGIGPGQLLDRLIAGRRSTGRLGPARLAGDVIRQTARGAARSWHSRAARRSPNAAALQLAPDC